MATVKKGILTNAGEWWTHLRWAKRAFWKGERQAAKADARLQTRDVRSQHRPMLRSTHEAVREKTDRDKVET